MSSFSAATLTGSPQRSFTCACVCRRLAEGGRIVQRRPVEEADIHVGTERVDVAERGVSHTRRGMPVLQKLANVRAAPAHPLEPWLGHAPQLMVRHGEPGVDAGSRRMALGNRISWLTGRIRT